PRGGPWSTVSLRAMLRRPRLAAERTYHGEVVAQGRWPAILDADTARALQARLANRSTIPGLPGHEYLLTGFLTCARCGRRLHGHRARAGTGKIHPRYVCDGPWPERKYCTGIVGDPLDAFIGAALLDD